MLDGSIRDPGSLGNPLFDAFEYDQKGLAIYDRDKLTQGFPDAQPQEWKFRDPSKKLDALVAVYLLKN